MLQDETSKDTLSQIVNYRLTLRRDHLLSVAGKTENEYFDTSVIRVNKEEVFVDGGAYDGDSIKKFMNVTKRSFKKIYAYEPDTKLYNKVKAYVASLGDKRIRLDKIALGGRNGTVRFTNDATTGSRASHKGNTRITVRTLDDILVTKKVTFIKLDIEGAEWAVLHGAKKIIRANRPKLAICVYHKTEDLWRIALLLKKYVPSYSFVLRHYGKFLYDTILYAIPSND